MRGGSPAGVGSEHFLRIAPDADLPQSFLLFSLFRTKVSGSLGSFVWQIDGATSGVFMAGVALGVLSFALAIWWVHSGMTLCTMGEPLALKMSVVLTFFPYLVAMALLARARMGPVAMVCALPVVLLLLLQAGWAVQLLITTNINGVTSCKMIKAYYYGQARGGWFEQVIGPYYIVVSIASICLVTLSHLRHRMAARPKTKAEVFE